MENKNTIILNWFDIERLAHLFSLGLVAQLGPEKTAEVIRRNAAENNPCICHSHDFCDANQGMHEAMEELGLDPEDEAIWNAAWSLAKEKGFQIAG